MTVHWAETITSARHSSCLLDSDSLPERSWLGKAPDGWSTARVGDQVRLVNGHPFDSDLFTLDDGMPLVRIRDLGSLSTEIRYRGEAVAEAIVRRGDILIGMDGDFVVARWRGDAALLNQRVCCLRPRPSIDGQFLFYALSLPLRIVNDLTYSTTVKHLSSSQVKALRLPSPPIHVQRAIADYLDRETERIDALVAKKQRLIGLLQEKRTALISHAVTKGLDPDAPMKDSGIEWFGRIPAHWPVVRLGHFAHVQNGSTPSRDDAACWLDGTVPWLASTKVNEDRVTSPSELVSETALRECSLTLMPAGSVIIGLVGQGRTRGMAALLDIEATINQNMAAIIPRRRIVGRHLQFQLESMYIPIREYGRGANQAALNCELVADLHLPSPPPAEQVAIARFLDERTEAIRALVDKTRRSIDLLGESRSTLITAAVTGQIDVSAR